MSTRPIAPDTAATRFRPTKHRLRTGWLPLALLLATVPALALAQAQQPAALQRPAGDEAFVTLRINGVTRGEFLVIKAGDDFWMSQDDLARLKIAFPAGPPGPGFNSLLALGASRLEFLEGELVLQVTFPGDALQATRVDLGSAERQLPLVQAPASLILSYRLSHRTLPSGGRQTSALTDLNVRAGPLLLRQESRIDTGAQQRGFARGPTQAVFDQPEHARRWIAGDVLATAGSFGTSITGAGLHVSKIWTMSPDALRQPRGQLRTTTALPAQVELSVDGTTIFRGNVNPGPIEFDNLQYAGGQRDLRLVVTDVSGRRTVIEQPFFFADTTLAAGVHDYSYFIGRRSELGSDNRWAYKEPAAQGFHRYGATDNLTVGAGGEASADFATIGAGASLRSDRLGLFSLDLLANRDRRLRRGSNGWAARYAFQTPFFSAIAGLRMFDRGFRSFGANASAAFPARDARLALSSTVGSTSYSLEWTRRRGDLETRTTTALRVFRSLGNRELLSADLRSTVANGRRQSGFGVTYRRYLDPVNWLGADLDVTGDARTLTTEVGRQLPAGEGLGYRASLIDVSQTGGHFRTGALNATYNLQPAAIEVAASTQSGGGTFGEVALTGAVVALDGHMGLSRQVGDSFLLARLGVPEPGIEVLLNNQVQGRTDAKGQLFIPNVASFDRQDISVNDKQIPMTYQLGRRGVVIAPAYRSGAVVDFGMRRQRAAVGQAWRLQGGRRTPVAEHRWTMSGPSGTLAIETSSTGDFYVEDAPPGTYAGRLAAGGELQCTLVIPPSPEPVQELREGLTCE